MNWWVEPFTLGFEQRALIGGALAGLMSSIVGTWLVLRVRAVDRRLKHLEMLRERND